MIMHLILFTLNSRLSKKKSLLSFNCYINKVITYQKYSSVWWYSVEMSKIIEPELSYCHCYHYFFDVSVPSCFLDKISLFLRIESVVYINSLSDISFLMSENNISSLCLNYTFLIFATPSFLYYQKYRNKLT